MVINGDTLCLISTAWNHKSRRSRDIFSGQERFIYPNLLCDISMGTKMWSYCPKVLTHHVLMSILHFFLVTIGFRQSWQPPQVWRVLLMSFEHEWWSTVWMKHAGISHCAASLQTWVIKAPRLERRPAQLSVVHCSWKYQERQLYRAEQLNHLLKMPKFRTRADTIEERFYLSPTCSRPSTCGSNHRWIHNTPWHFSVKKLGPTRHFRCVT